jgi:hypothetical protein
MELKRIQSSISQLITSRQSLVIGLFVSCGILLLSGALGYLAERLPLMLLLGGVGGLIFSLIAIRNMPAALTLLVATSTTVGFTIGTGSQTPLPFGMLILAFLVGLWLLRMMLIERQIMLVPHPVNFPFLAFVVASLISWIVGYAVWDWRITGQNNLFLVQAGQIAIFVLTVAALLLVLNHPLKEKTLKLWVVILICIGAISYATWIFVRYGGIFPDGTGVVLVWAIVLLWGQVLFNPELKPWMRLAGGGISLLWMYWIYAQVFVWKGGWLPSLIAFFGMLWFRSRRAFLAFAAIACVIIVLNWGWINQNVVIPETGTASTLRPLYWYDVIRMTSRSILFGLGPANYTYYWSDPTFIPLSRIANGWDTWDEWGYAPPSHNSFVDIYSQTGLIGIILFLWGVLVALLASYKIATRLPYGFMKGFAFSVLFGFIALCFSSMFFADWLVPYVYNLTITGFRHTVYSWLLLGALLAFDRSTGEKCNDSNA